MKIMIVEDLLLNSIGYDSDSKILELRFNDGEIRQYFQISDQIYNQLIDSKSHADYFKENIATNHPSEIIEYPYLKIDY